MNHQQITQKDIDNLVPALPPEKHHNPDHLAFQFQIVHEHCGNNPHAVRVSASLELETEQQTYQRLDIKVGKEWTKLETGWLGTNYGKIVIEHKLCPKKYARSTPEQKRELLKNKVYIGLFDDSMKKVFSWIVTPSWPFIGEPEEVAKGNIYIRSDEPATININVFPR